MALTAAYFVGEILVPNISGATTTEQANLFQLQVAIAKYEPLYLKMLLGDDTYDLYVAGVAANEARWLALRGKIYIENETLSVGFSPAANYVYFFFMRNQYTLSTVNAEVTPTMENMAFSNSYEKQVRAWNEMIELSLDIREWLTDNESTYPEWADAEYEILGSINFAGC